MPKNKIYVGVGLAAIGLLLFLATAIHALYYDPQQEMAIPATLTSAAIRTLAASSTDSLPVRLQIPSIGVDAKVVPVGITLKGNMSVPNNFVDVGWYKYGTVPGNVGSAVIDGHVDNGLSLPGVFKHLKEVPVGEDIFVTAENGKILHYVVTDIQIYYYTQLPLEQIFNANDASRLNLITCDGTWIPSAKTDDHRVVVYSKLAN